MKNKTNIAMILIFILFLVLFLLGLKFDWFGGITNIYISNDTDKGGTETPVEDNVFTTCTQLCVDKNYDYGKAGANKDVCGVGEDFLEYGYPGEIPLLKCCCGNTVEPCVDSDGGKIYNVGGNVRTSLGIMYDTCQPNGMDLLEMYCENGGQKSAGIGCPNGCIEGASGDYCSSTHVWHPGDTVMEGSGAGDLIGVENGYAEIDLNDYGFTVGGTCRLGAQISTTWLYTNPTKCQGITGQKQGLKWEFYDSLGLEYTRTDLAPLGVGIDLHPESHILDWDGHTKWRAYAKPTVSILPECILHYDYDIRIYIYDC